MAEVPWSPVQVVLNMLYDKVRETPETDEVIDRSIEHRPIFGSSDSTVSFNVSSLNTNRLYECSGRLLTPYGSPFPISRIRLILSVLPRLQRPPVHAYAMYKHRHDSIQNVISDACQNSEGKSLTIDSTFRGHQVPSAPTLSNTMITRRKPSSWMSRVPSSANPLTKLTLKNCRSILFYDRRLKRLKWSARPVYTLICSSSGVIPQCSRSALKALGVEAPSIVKPTLEKINIACIKAGYKIRKSFAIDRRRCCRILHNRNLNI